MRKITTLIYMVLLLFGCAATEKPEFRIAPDKNTLDFGSSQVFIDKKFEMIGELEDKLIADNIDDQQGTPFKITQYIFADTSDGKNKIKRAISVADYRMKNHHHYFLGGASFDGYKERCIDKGMTDHIGARCAYLIRNVNRISKKVLELGASKGFYADSSLGSAIEITFARNVASSRQIRIIYLEAGKTVEADDIFKRAIHSVRLEN
jgi:hypothetical protein